MFYFARFIINMDWSLITRCGARYTLLYAVATVVIAYSISRSGMVLIGLIGLGLVSLTISLGAGEVNTTSAGVANAQAGGLQSGIVDPVDLQAKTQPYAIKLLFYGIGLIICSAAVLITIG